MINIINIYEIISIICDIFMNFLKTCAKSVKSYALDPKIKHAWKLEVSGVMCGWPFLTISYSLAMISCH